MPERRARFSTTAQQRRATTRHPLFSNSASMRARTTLDLRLSAFRPALQPLHPAPPCRLRLGVSPSPGESSSYGSSSSKTVPLSSRTACSASIMYWLFCLTPIPLYLLSSSQYTSYSLHYSGSPADVITPRPVTRSRLSCCRLEQSAANRP